MIYEMITCDLKTRATKEVEKRFAEAHEHRQKYSRLAAFWHTEIGLIDQIVSLWPYRDLLELMQVREATANDPKAVPDVGQFIVRQQSDILTPFACSPEIKPCSMGPFFEMRIYTYLPGGLPSLMAIWNEAVAWRVQFGPVLGLFHTEIGARNRFIHIWPYKTLDERMEIREKSKAPGKWPPHMKSISTGGSGYDLVSRENKILVPAAFSPVQ